MYSYVIYLVNYSILQKNAGTDLAWEQMNSALQLTNTVEKNNVIISFRSSPNPKFAFSFFCSMYWGIKITVTVCSSFQKTIFTSYSTIFKRNWSYSNVQLKRKHSNIKMYFRYFLKMWVEVKISQNASPFKIRNVHHVPKEGVILECFSVFYLPPMLVLIKLLWSKMRIKTWQ